jgi:plasmid rolling circle replication initiator protein Rep
VYNENGKIQDFGDCIDQETFEKYKRLTISTYKAISQTLTLSDKAENIYNCGSFIVVDNEAKKVARANFCRERFCPMCQKRKSLKQYAECRKLSETVGDSYRFLHCVLTVRNCEAYELSTTIDKLYKASRELFKDKRIMQGWKGELRALEVTYSQKQHNYHPHLHCLIAVKPSYFTSRYYLKVETVRELWQKYLGVDYLPQVSIGKCDEDGFAEVAKYCVKPLDLSLPSALHAEVLDNLNRALKGRRLLQYYGILRDVHSALKWSDVEKEADEDFNVSRSDMLIYDFSLSRYEKQSYLTFLGLSNSKEGG